MRALTSYEYNLLKLHPDELDLVAIRFLSDPDNAPVLREYEAAWADVIATRRPNQRPSHPLTH